MTEYKGTNLDARDATIYTQGDIITAQAATIERLADALEFALNPFTYKTWPEHWTLNDVEQATAAARALLAEIRGKHA